MNTAPARNSVDAPGGWKTPHPASEIQPKINRFELLAGIILMIAFFGWVLLFVDRVVMPLVVYQGVEVPVPRFINMPYARADSLAKFMRLEVQKAGTRIDDSLIPGTVIDQSPAPNLTVKRGRVIELVTSARAELIRCPNLVGRSPLDADLIADSTGVRVNDKATTYAFSSSVPYGVVMRQNPRPGESVNKGEPLSLVVSLGIEPRIIKAPSLIGLRADEIRMLMASRKLTVGKSATIADSTVAPGTIVWQSPVVGTAMSPGGQIDIKVSSGKKP